MMMVHYCSWIQSKIQIWVIKKKWLHYMFDQLRHSFVLNWCFITWAFCWYNWLTVDFISRSLFRSSSFVDLLDWSQDIRSELGSVDLFISANKFVDRGSKTFELALLTVYFLPDDSGRGRIFISVFVALWSEKVLLLEYYVK